MITVNRIYVYRLYTNIIFYIFPDVHWQRVGHEGQSTETVNYLQLHFLMYLVMTSTILNSGVVCQLISLNLEGLHSNIFTLVNCLYIVFIY